MTRRSDGRFEIKSSSRKTEMSLISGAVEAIDIEFLRKFHLITRQLSSVGTATTPCRKLLERKREGNVFVFGGLSQGVANELKLIDFENIRIAFEFRVYIYVLRYSFQFYGGDLYISSSEVCCTGFLLHLVNSPNARTFEQMADCLSLKIATSYKAS